MIEDKYKEVKNQSTGIYKEKGSKFIAYSYPVYSEDQVKEKLEEVRKLEYSARHYCYAYILNPDKSSQRANDDGEPNNSAGMPIYGQIQSFDVTNVLIVSVRYFGGTKLGVGGLINAYKTSAQISLEASEIIEKTIDIFFQLNFQYDVMNKVMRIVKEKNLTIVSQKLEMDCEYVISIRKKDARAIFDVFDNLYKVDIKTLE